MILRMHDASRKLDAPSVLRLLSLLLCLACMPWWLAGCSNKPVAPPAEPAPEQPDYWTTSHSVTTDRSMITLFDPDDLTHHTADPANWYLYDFAFNNDLETGRFVAFLTKQEGTYQVRITSAPLSDREQAAAGPKVSMRLRVINNRLLLAGGESWPSIDNPQNPYITDPRWFAVANGDYQVTVTALDQSDPTLHDYVIRMEPVSEIQLAKSSPGIPQLIHGQRLGMAGLNAKGASYAESCNNIPRSAEWSPLLSSALPLPGAIQNVVVPKELHSRGHAQQRIGKRASLPVVISRSPSSDVLGLFFDVARWNSPVKNSNAQLTARGRIACAVRITNVNSGERHFTLNIKPLPASYDRLPNALASELVNRFDVWIRLSNDPGWRFKSGMVQRATDDRSLVLSIMHYMALPATVSEELIQKSNHELARELFQRMGNNVVSS